VKPQKLLFIGDSIALGLGARGRPFPKLIEDELAREHEVTVWNASINGATVRDHVAQLDSYVAFRADIVVFAVGSVDAQTVPRKDRAIDLVRLLPRRYQQPGWLAPRPYLPASFLKRNLYAIPESFIRTRVNRAIMRLQGIAPTTSPEQFGESYRALVRPLLETGARGIACGVGPIDPALFPGADATFTRVRNIISDVARETGCRLVDMDAALPKPPKDPYFLLDHFHPSGLGHGLMARALLPVLRELLEQQRATA
jgi:lysophospholipase L1-like esterase